MSLGQLCVWSVESSKSSCNDYVVRCTPLSDIQSALMIQVARLSGAIVKLREATISFVISVRPSAWNNSAPTGRIFMKFDLCWFLETLSRKFNFHYNLTRMTGTLHEDQFTFISRSVLLRMRNVSGKSCRANRNTHFVFSNSDTSLDVEPTVQFSQSIVKINMHQAIHC